MRFDISEIYTIVFKTEPLTFSYFCPARLWDGFVLFTEGCGEFEISGIRYPVQAGSLVLLRRKDCYRFVFPGRCAYVTAAFDLCGCTVIDRLPAVQSANGEMIRNILQTAALWQRQTPADYMRTKVSLLLLYTDLSEKNADVAGRSEHPAVRCAVHFLHENYMRLFSSAEMANACHISISELRALFSRSMHCTITAYRDALRMQRAKEMLRFSDFSIKEVADALGYCDVYHFSKTFRRLVGVNPGAYAKKGEENSRTL